MLALPSLASAQQASIHYVYDRQNRLAAVVDQQGNVAVYVYDLVGNLLRIDRVDADSIPGAVAITLVTPNRGQVGASVQIFGKGFSATASQNSLAFNGTSATITSASPHRLVTSVPAGATTGLIAVTTPSGSAASPSAFVVSGGALTLTPPAAFLLVGGTQQFDAREDGVPTTNVRWAVTGPLGDPVVGMITSGGFYQAPANLPGSTAVIVTAVHNDDPALTASATITLQPPRPLLVSTTMSVAVAPSAITVAGGLVSVTQAAPLTALTTGLVSVAAAPIISSMSPAAGARSASISITLAGTGLSGATGLTALLNGVADSAIGVSNLSVSPDGTQATVDLAIGSGATLGARVMQITTPTGVSTPAGIGGNVFTVQ